MQRNEDRFTFEDNDKFVLVSFCEHCHTQNTQKIPLEKIFKMIKARVKATMGPIESIKALLNYQKPVLQ